MAFIFRIEAIQICRSNDTTAAYDCEKAAPNILEGLDLPLDCCDNVKCDLCVQATRTYILHADTLFNPAQFFEKPTSSNGTIDTFFCASTDTRGDMIPLPCDCSKNCSGSEDFCSKFHCVDNGPCRCDVRKMQYELSHISSDVVIVNPTLISMSVCLFRLPTKGRRSRQLQEYEGAAFSNHNLTLVFNDPVVTLPEPGKLIARVSGNELILPIQQDLNVVLPPEFVAFKDTLTLIFISNSGKAVHGDISLEGKTVCRLSNCIFCRDFFSTSNVGPHTFHICFMDALLFLLSLCYIY